MSEPRPRCPVCDSESLLLREIDSYPIARCVSCRHAWVERMPSPDELKSMYDTSESHMWNSAAFQVLLDYQNNPECVRRYFHRERTKFLDRYFPDVMSTSGAAMLDVGCSTGVFLATMRDRGWEVSGSDLSPTATRKGEETLDIPLSTDPLSSERYQERFDLVTCYDVIEHVLDPAELVRSITPCVKPGGRVVFRTPNHAGWLLGLTGKKWLWYIPPAHLHYFNAKSLTMLMEANGLQVEHVRTGSSTYLFFLWYYLAFWSKPGTTLSVDMSRSKERVIYGLDNLVRCAGFLPIVWGRIYHKNPMLEIYARKPTS